MQRVRILLPYFREYGWDVEVLAVDPDQVSAPQDPFLLDTMPADIPVYRVKGLGLGWTRIPGFGILTFRALGALRRKGDRLLREKSFDLIYFSTTQFGIQQLGARWKRRFGLPFIIDYQDPWVNDYYQKHPEIIPPGGRLKYSLVSKLNRHLEPYVLRHCSGITSVSPEYPRQLFSRYSFLPSDWPVKILPFPGDVRDFDSARKAHTTQPFFNTGDGCLHWIYVGVVGPIMEGALKGLFSAVASSSIKPSIKMHFIGTSYAPVGKGKKSVMPIAEQYGITGVVEEVTDRVPYSQALACLMDADALIVPGSNDPGYTASKIYPYLLARKPLLTIFHENSSVVPFIDSVGGAVSISFSENESTEQIAGRISTEWLESGAYEKPKPINEVAFDPYTGRGSAVIMGNFFDKVLESTQSHG